MKYKNWLFGQDGALFQASALGEVNTAKELINNGANVNIVSNNHFTPLHRAAQNGHRKIVELLLSKGANACIKSKNNKTPLSLAEENSHKDIVDILRKYY